LTEIKAFLHKTLFSRLYIVLIGQIMFILIKFLQALKTATNLLYFASGIMKIHLIIVNFLGDYIFQEPN